MILMDDIVFDDDPRIRQVSTEVEFPVSDEIRKTLLEMHQFLINSQDEETCKKYDLRPGVGIAGVQIGVLKRICAIHVVNGDEDGNITSVDDYALVNPKIISHTKKQAYLKDGEGCLSVEENIEGYVPRYAKVTVKGYDILTDKEVTIVARGFLAICLQHELDHFDGILFYDYINKEFPKKPIKDAVVIQ
jgi:peptide deformylase